MEVKLSATSESLKKISPRKVPFEFYALQARSVSLAGTFNDWNPTASSLKKGNHGKWRITLSLPPGRYEYRYLVDGIWKNDQQPGQWIPNVFGSWNCVAEIK